MKRYSSLECLFSFDLEDAISLIDYAFRQQDEERMFLRWVVGPQYEMSFDDFKNRLVPSKPKSEKEILENVYGIIASIQKEGG